MRAREYLVLQECVEAGVQRGWAKAHKHNDAPTPDQIQAFIETAILNEINEYFIFDEHQDVI